MEAIMRLRERENKGIDKGTESSILEKLGRGERKMGGGGGKEEDQ